MRVSISIVNFEEALHLSAKRLLLASDQCYSRTTAIEHIVDVGWE